METDLLEEEELSFVYPALLTRMAVELRPPPPFPPGQDPLGYFGVAALGRPFVVPDRITRKKCLPEGSHRLPVMIQSLERGSIPEEMCDPVSGGWAVASSSSSTANFSLPLSFPLPSPAHGLPLPVMIQSLEPGSIPEEMCNPVSGGWAVASSSSSSDFSLPSPFPLPSPAHGLPLPSRSINQRALRAPNTSAGVRRRRISDRMRRLAKLLPCDRKMPTSTMLEEARNYVEFLQAQVTVLRCMPAESRFSCASPPSSAAAAPALRGLEKLTRQQVLHVLVRSPLVQDKLCGRGLCVFAAEQVIPMREAAEKKALILHEQQQQQQTMLDSGSTSTVVD